MSRSAGIVAIGNELLSGEIRDQNAVYLLAQLRELGVEVRRLVVLPDEVPPIRDEIRTAAAEFDYVFTSGGVGPTHDDVTMPAIAAAFGRRLTRNPQFEAVLHGYYQEAITEATLRMADLPEGAVLQGEGRGWFPLIVVENVYVFPGVPEILRARFEAVRETFRDDPFFSSHVFLRADEGRVAPLLDEVVARFPGLRLGSYPDLSHPAYSLKLTLDSKDRGLLDSARTALLEGLAALSITTIPLGEGQSSKSPG